MNVISYSFWKRITKKKKIISISILIYIEMNPNAKERVLETGPIAVLRHQQASPRENQNPSSMSVKCSATFQRKSGEGELNILTRGRYTGSNVRIE